MDSKGNSPPVAVRVLRPYGNEDALLEAESNAFTRTGVVLIGAPSRPNGVVLRFEICLRDGHVAMRGEGRVVGFRAASSGEETALMLRFTRLDVKSKSLLDRAVALREERKSLAPPASRPAASSRPATPPPPPPPRPMTSKPPPPVASVAPTTDRDAPDDDDDAAMDVDDADLTSADDEDLTQQAPPVAMIADIIAQQAPPAEKMPLPQRSPVEPKPHPVAPQPKTPPPKPPEQAPPQRAPAEKMPHPQSSPGPKLHASDLVARARGERQSGEFRPSLEPEQRDSALDRLRKRTSQV